jgi:type I restriction enzyme S subunit
MNTIKFENLFQFQKKSKIKAGDGFKLGKAKYPFYTSSNVLTKSIDEYLFEDESLIFGTGGLASIHFCNVKFAVSTDCFVTQPKNVKDVFSKYVYYYLSGNLHILDNGFKGAGLKHISKDYLANIQIPLPPLPTQQKIASILDAADTLRQKDKALLAKYDELTQSLFLDMFGDPVSNFKGWEIKNIEQITKSGKGSIKRGPFGGALKKEIFVEDGYLVYEQFHALNNDFSRSRYFIDENKFNELKGFEVHPNDIIISCSGVYLGKLAIVPKGARKGIINQALLKITLDESKMKNDFFVFLFSHKNFREKYFDANRGAGIPNFPPMSEFKRFPFITPSMKLQEQFTELITIIEQQKAIAQASLEKSEELFNSLLQKAFKGELV